MEGKNCVWMSCFVPAFHRPRNNHAHSVRCLPNFPSLFYSTEEVQSDTKIQFIKLVSLIEEWVSNKQKLLADKIDVTQFVGECGKMLKRKIFIYENGFSNWSKTSVH